LDSPGETETKTTKIGFRLPQSAIAESASPQEGAVLDANFETNVDASTGSPYAYVFMLWGCDPDEPKSFKGSFANILIAAKLLRSYGSQADIVAIFKVKYESPYELLAEEDERLLSALNVQFRYLPKTPDKKGYAVFLNKFHVYSMTEYQRVLFLDTDVLPMTNLDYIFELSVGKNAILKENVVVPGYMEPSNAGFFMIKPNATAYEDISRLIEWRCDADGSLKPLDPVIGWGHQIQPPDLWEDNKSTGTNWTFVSKSVLYRLTNNSLALTKHSYAVGCQDRPGTLVPLSKVCSKESNPDSYTEDSEFRSRSK